MISLLMFFAFVSGLGAFLDRNWKCAVMAIAAIAGAVLLTLEGKC